ncbi:MAG: hypothetical protein OXT69_12655 [Candidatus Poribacteria bacterium]|nr:hypothetical protein [Candidatus Poribacteria bacterium]
MSATKRKKRLALLVGAVLLAALAIGVAVLFQSNDTDPAAQTNPPEAVGSSEPRKETGAPNAGGAAQEKESSEISPRLAKILQTLYDHRGPESNPKIRDWLVRYGNKLIADGEEDSDIISLLDSDLWDMREVENPGELERFIEISREDHLYDETESDGWQYDPEYSEKRNRIHKYRHERFGSSFYRKGKTPRAVIEILVEGMGDLTAAKYLIDTLSQRNDPEYRLFPDVSGEYWGRREKEYAAEYADRALEKNPAERDALIVKIYSGVDVIESAQLLVEHHPDDERAVLNAARELYLNYPEKTIDAISRILPEDGLHSYPEHHLLLGSAYERLDMMYEAADQFQKAYAAGETMAGRFRFSILERGERSYPSIWEERAAAEAAKQTPQPAEASAPPRPPDAPMPSETPRGVEPPPPPPNLEAEMSAAYADFAKAYQSAFEMEYALSDATSEGYMNALLDMARAFARAGDAQRAQDAYNAVRKRHSREEIEQAFRRFDERERLKRQPPGGEEDDDSGEEE